MHAKSTWLLVVMSLTFLVGSTSARRVTTEKNLSSLPNVASVPKEWKPFLDPSNDDFWREGNHIPDLLLWAKNPTKENAKLYLMRMNMKRNLLHKMYEQQKEANIELIKEGLIADDYDFLSQGIGQKSQTKTDLQTSLADTHIFFFYSPTCMHSRRQADVLRGLQNVTPLQVGGNLLMHFNALPESLWAEKEDLEKHKIGKRLPVLLVYNNQLNKMLRLEGFQPIENIIKAAGSIRK